VLTFSRKCLLKFARKLKNVDYSLNLLHKRQNLSAACQTKGHHCEKVWYEILTDFRENISFCGRGIFICKTFFSRKICKISVGQEQVRGSWKKLAVFAIFKIFSQKRRKMCDFLENFLYWNFAQLYEFCENVHIKLFLIEPNVRLNRKLKTFFKPIRGAKESIVHLYM
jgi:hypothetical protein